ncbi:MAG: hypothetical protein JWO64_1978, partial [Hyphomicrobiales bacterium]|nr:hypothetical protein [Hyphomicrobiales bacterium]
MQESIAGHFMSPNLLGSCEFLLPVARVFHSDIFTYLTAALVGRLYGFPQSFVTEMRV